MGYKTWHIEFRTDFNDKKKDKIMEKVLRELAHAAFANATLLSDNRKPQVALSTNDAFIGAQDLLLFDENTGIDDSEEPPADEAEQA